MSVYSSRPVSDDSAYRLRYAAGILLCLIGAAIGLRLPDFDRAFVLPPLMLHRSLITHGFLLPLLLYVLVRASSRSRPEGTTVLLSHPHANPCGRLFALGFCAGVPVHLCFDLFPRAWSGWALIYAPITGYLSPAISIVWLSVSILFCLYLGCRLLRNLGDLTLGIGCGAACYGIQAAQEPRSAVYALFVLTIVMFFAFVLPRPKRSLL